MFGAWVGGKILGMWEVMSGLHAVTDLGAGESNLWDTGYGLRMVANLISINIYDSILTVPTSPFLIYRPSTTNVELISPGQLG